MNRELLEHPFEASQIKQRQGVYGDLLDYVEGATVIQRLNDSLEGQWTFEVEEYRIEKEEVWILGRLSHAGIIKMQFGKSTITRSSKDGSLISLGDDLKAAATDSLKKCATLFGVGLHLYFEDNGKASDANAPAKSVPASGTTEPQPQPNGRLTARQLSAIYGIARSKGLGNKEIRAFTQQRFKKVPDFLSRQEASRAIEQLQQEGSHA